MKPVYSNPKIAALFDNASLGIVITDSEGRIKAINPFALKLFGYNPDEIQDQPVEALIPSRYHQRHVHHRETYIHKPVSRPMGIGMDLFAVKKDGTEFPVEVSLGNYVDNGEHNVIAFINDITVRKRTELEIIKLNDELESLVDKRTIQLTEAMHQLEISKEELSKSLAKEKELGELKSRFVSMASHEFRTPLSTVLSSAYLIGKYTTTEEQGKRDRHLDRIISSVNMLTDILNDFLSVGRIEEGKIQVKNALLDIKKLISSIIDAVVVTLKKDQQIIYRHTGNTEFIIDPSLMKHIALNMISNASKFSPEASHIEISTSCDENKFIFSVSDHGMGISRDDQQHLMERFFRGTNAGSIQGTGLGLHIIARYAELMGGTVTCISELEKGSEFSITFIKKNDADEKNIAN